MDQQPRGMGAQLTVAQQIGLIVGVAVFALVLILVLSLVRVQTLGNTVDRLATEQVERLQLALRWRSNIAVNSTRVFSIVQTEGDDLQNYFKDVVAATTADTSKVQKRYTELENSPQGLLIQEELATIRKSYLETRDKSLALKKAGDMAQARAYALGSFAPVLDLARGNRAIGDRAFAADPLPSRQSQMDVIASSRPAAALARLRASQPAMRVSPMRRTSSGPAICPAAKPVVMRASSGVGLAGMRSRAS